MIIYPLNIFLSKNIYEVELSDSKPNSIFKNLKLSFHKEGGFAENRKVYETKGFME